MKGVLNPSFGKQNIDNALKPYMQYVLSVSRDAEIGLGRKVEIQAQDIQER